MRISAICCSAGVAVCFAALFIPAVSLPPIDRPGVSGPVDGWVCAIAALFGGVLAIPNGQAKISPILGPVTAVTTLLINPLVVVYIVLLLREKSRRALLITAGAIAGCCVTMWFYLSAARAELLIGHYVWISGIALILCSPLMDRFSPQGVR